MKWIGLGLIFAGCTWGGFSYLMMLQHRLKEWERLIAAFSLMKEEISHLALPMQAIFSDLAVHIDGQTGRVFAYCAQRMAQEGHGDLADLWEEGWKRENTVFSGEDLEFLYTFRRFFVAPSRKERQAETELFLTMLEKRTEQLRQKLADNHRLYPGFGVMGGLFMVIFLL